MTYFQNKGIKIFLSNSPINSQYDGNYQDLTQYITSYSHTISASIGFDSAVFSFPASIYNMEQLVESAVGKRVVVYNEGGSMVWEGFVNSIDYEFGVQRTSRGNLMDVSNRVSVSYAPLNILVSPPEVGEQTYTLIEEDEDSQDKYGILETIVSGGTLQDADAENIRDLYLKENKHVITTNTVSVGVASEPSIKFNCLGYYHWLEKYVYNCSDTGTTMISDRIEAILDFNPNTKMYSATNNIGYNPWLIVAFDEDNKTASTHIKELLAFGDANDNRYIFGCYENRVFEYKVVPTEYEYYTSSLSGGDSIRNDNNTAIAPYDVRPGKWLMITDMLIGTSDSQLASKDDPRGLFIETVDYTMPTTLLINGERISTFKQRLAVFAGIGSF